MRCRTADPVLGANCPDTAIQPAETSKNAEADTSPVCSQAEYPFCSTKTGQCGNAAYVNSPYLGCSGPECVDATYSYATVLDGCCGKGICEILSSRVVQQGANSETFPKKSTHLPVVAPPPAWAWILSIELRRGASGNPWPSCATPRPTMRVIGPWNRQRARLLLWRGLLRRRQSSL